MHIPFSYQAGLIERTERMQHALIRLWREGILSEGQVSSMTGLDRVSCRQLAIEQEQVDEHRARIQQTKTPAE